MATVWSNRISRAGFYWSCGSTGFGPELGPIRTFSSLCEEIISKRCETEKTSKRCSAVWVIWVKPAPNSGSGPRTLFVFHNPDRTSSPPALCAILNQIFGSKLRAEGKHPAAFHNTEHRQEDGPIRARPAHDVTVKSHQRLPVAAEPRKSENKEKTSDLL